MLKHGVKYVMQLVRSADGVRSEPFVCTLLALQTACVDLTKEEMDAEFVLILADTSADSPTSFVARFPLYRLGNFLEYVATNVYFPDSVLNMEDSSHA